MGGHYVPISIHALREEGDPLRGHFGFVVLISIHALREEGDPPCTPPGKPLPISIHALREEGDGCRLGAHIAPEGFLSTPSARRATERKADREQSGV